MMQTKHWLAMGTWAIALAAACGSGESAVVATTAGHGGGGSGGGAGSTGGGTGSTGGGTCANGTRDGDESDIDCGGPVCDKCLEGQDCAIDRDCASDLCSAGKCAAPCEGCHLWSKRFGSTGFDFARAAAVDSAGNVLLAGDFNYTINFGGGVLTSAGQSDVFIAKLASNGTHVWSQRFGDADSQVVTDVAFDSAGNVLVGGHFGGTLDFGGGALTSMGGSDVFVAKFSSTGAHVWSKRFGDASSQFNTKLAVDSSGDVVVTGQFEGAIEFGGGALTSAGGRDVFVAKLSATGAHVWSAAFGDAADQWEPAVAIDANGNVAVAGGLVGTMDFGGGPLTSAGSSNAFIAKLSPAGTHLWSQRFGTDIADASAIASDSSGNLLVSGSFYKTIDFGGGVLTSEGGYDAYVAKFSPTGTHLWSQRFGDSNEQRPSAVAVGTADDVLVTGYFKSTIDFGGGALSSAGQEDAFVAKFSPTGKHLWSRRFGDPNYQYTFDVAVDATGRVLLAGVFEGTVDFGGGGLASMGNFDIFAVQLTP